MNTMGLPKEAVDGIRLWMDPAQAAGTGVRAALVAGQSARATQQTVTEQLWNWKDVDVLDRVCQTSEEENQEAIWGMPWSPRSQSFK